MHAGVIFLSLSERASDYRTLFTLSVSKLSFHFPIDVRISRASPDPALYHLPVCTPAAPTRVIHLENFLICRAQHKIRTTAASCAHKNKSPFRYARRAVLRERCKTLRAGKNPATFSFSY